MLQPIIDWHIEIHTGDLSPSALRAIVFKFPAKAIFFLIFRIPYFVLSLKIAIFLFSNIIYKIIVLLIALLCLACWSQVLLTKAIFVLAFVTLGFENRFSVLERRKKVYWFCDRNRRSGMFISVQNRCTYRIRWG